MFDSHERPLLPDNIKALKPYIPGKTIEEVREAYRPEQISKLASNENRLGCSPRVAGAVERALEYIHDYPDPVAGALRKAVAKRNDVAPENVLFAAGSESIIANLCRTFFREGEEAITADVTFIGFYVQAGIAGIELVKTPVTKDYRYDVEALAHAVTNKTKMIYIANPNNPTGTYITKEEFEWLMKQIPDDVLVVMDEAYLEFTGDVEDYPHAMSYDYDNVLSLRTFSKAYGLAGFRIGYAIGHEKLIESMLKTKLAFEPAGLAQAAALAAFEDEAFLNKSIGMVVNGRRRLYDFFDAHGLRYVPSISNSVLMVMDTEQEARQLTQHMLQEGVILRRTDAFGLPNCIRITIGTKKEMDHLEASFKKIGLV